MVFDIVITYPDTSKTAIEVHGVTHFKPTYLSKNKSFEAVRERDNIKYTYCENIIFLFTTLLTRRVLLTTMDIQDIFTQMRLNF